jgi:hypothetical protein
MVFLPYPDFHPAQAMSPGEQSISSYPVAMDAYS